MFAAYAAAHSEFERLIADPKSIVGMVKRAELQPARIVTDTDLEEIAARQADVTAQSFERQYRRANVDRDAAAELDRMVYDLERDAEEAREAIRTRHSNKPSAFLKPDDEARCVARDAGYAAAEGSEEFAAIIGAVRAGMERGYKRISALVDGSAVPALPDRQKVAPSPIGGTLADAVDEYLIARKPAPKTIAETRLALRQFEEVIGRKSLASITRSDARQFVQHLATVQVGGKTPGSIVRPLSGQSIKKRLRILASAIYHARDTDKFVGDNPLAGLKIDNLIAPKDRSVMPDKRRLQISELNAIFSHPWFTGCKSATDTHTPGTHRLSGSEFWVPIVALMTGCRASELGGLALSEVRLTDAMPHFLIRPNEHRGTKNGRSRCVPILDALIELGFPAYVDRIRRSGATRLFPDWTAIKPAGAGADAFPAWSNSKVIRAFNRTVIPSALADKLSIDARREVTFHSLRGTFKATIGTTNNLPINVVHEVVGHAKSELDARYIGEVTIEETYPQVKGLRYIGLIIPKL
ncbi:tyrosine-type recombinase/integrase [Sphingomonas aurantiaca]|uniref:tyrosine-type recombinase/integrase n=1 Tax=Sphingomonas aurantiaca TaxID=185949 RepID=UPI002FDF5E6A